MSKKLLMLVKQNLILSMRNSLVWVILVSMVIIILVVKFAIPDEISSGNEQYFVDNSTAKTIEKTLIRTGVDESRFIKDYQSLKDLINENKSAVGIIFSGSLEDPKIEVLQKTSINEEQLNLVQASLSKMIGTLNGTWNNDINIEFLRRQSDPIPRNIALVPVLLVFEVLILGFLLVAVFIFQEKGDRVILAYRISPGGTHLYILSKIISFLMIGIIYAFGIIAFTYGFNFNMLDFIILTILGFVLYTLIGLIVALFFEDISGWFIVGIVLLTLNMAPGLSHQLPSLSMNFIKYIPSYHIILGYDTILFSNQKSLISTFGLLSILTIAAYLLCYILVDKKLMKEAI